MKRIALLLIIITSFFSCKDEHSELPDGLYADIETSKGHIILKLEFEKAPVTVANFVTLTEGKNNYVSPEFKGKNFYDGLKFHRVEPNFVIQGGDPIGNGSGGPGYKFRDEFTDLTHSKAGTLSMANSGPGTNGSQFFITLDATPHLDGRHTVFGYVVGNGMETANKIVKDDGIISVTIIRKGEASKKFDAVKVFNNYFMTEAENQKKQALIDAENKKIYQEKYKEVLSKKTAYFQKLKAESQTTASGLSYKIIKKGSGKKPEPGTYVFLDYAGFFEDGVLFDTSIAGVAKEFGKFDENRAAQNGYNPIPFQAGQKKGVIPGFLEGINLLGYGDKIILFVPSSLGYGEAGYGDGAIPPSTNLIFELEMFEKPDSK